MGLVKSICVGILISITSISASAGLISTDWKEANDELVTLDEATGIEWLDLTETMGLSINEVSELLDTTYLGWRLPTFDEVLNLYSNIDSDIAMSTDSMNFLSMEESAAKAVVDLFGVTKYHTGSRWNLKLYISGGNYVSFNTQDTVYAEVRYATDNTYQNSNQYMLNNNYVTSGFNYTNTGVGVYLVNGGETTLVPEPASVGILGLALLTLVRCRTKYRIHSKK